MSVTSDPPAEVAKGTKAAQKDHETRNAEVHFLTWETDISDIIPSNAIPPSVLQYSDPTALSPRYKTFLTGLGCIANLSTTWSGGSYTSGVSAMAEEWNVSQTAIIVGVTIYTLGFAITPMALAPLSELYGRRPIFIISGIVFVISVICCGVTRIYAGMLVSRLLVGVASSTFAVVVVGVVADIFDDGAQRTNALVWFCAGALFGNGLGPLISGFIVQRLGWRWIFYILAMFLAGMILLFIICWKETRSEVLLSRKAHALNQWLDSRDQLAATSVPVTGAQNEKPVDTAPRQHIRFTTKADQERRSLLQMTATSLARPARLLITEPVVLFFSLWAAFSWSIMYALLIVIPYTFEIVYGYDLETASVFFVAMCIGTIIATVLSLLHSRIAALVFPKTLLESESPETCLYFAGVEGALLPIGLFWYGWSAQTGVHWISPAMALSCATIGMFSIYLAVFSYLSAAYRQYAASANAAQSFLRNTLGGAFPLFVKIMFKRLGFGGACSLLGGLGVLLTCVPWVLIFYGARIRAKSKFAFAD